MSLFTKDMGRPSSVERWAGGASAWLWAAGPPNTPIVLFVRTSPRIGPTAEGRSQLLPPSDEAAAGLRHRPPPTAGTSAGPLIRSFMLDHKPAIKV